MRTTTMWRRGLKDWAGAKVRLEAVYRDDLLTATDVDGESFITSLGHQIRPLVRGREGGANGSSVDINVEGLLK